MQQIASGLHCPICKDLSVADSPAPLAQQMRQQIDEQLAAGRSPDEIRSGFVAAYGDSVLMSPPRHGIGRTAYYLPLAVVLGGALVVAAAAAPVAPTVHVDGPEPDGRAPADVGAATGAAAGGRAAARGGSLMAGDWDGEVDRRRALLRQLRDLDDDLAAGKLTEEDHRRLREPIEHEAAVSLTRRPARTTTATAAGPVTPTTGPAAPRTPTTRRPPPSRRAGGRQRAAGGPAAGRAGGAGSGGSGRGPAAAVGLRRRGSGTSAARRQEPAATARRGPRTARSRARRIVPAVLAVAAVAGVTALLAGAITPRGAGQAGTGSGPAAVATAPPVGPTGGSAAAPADPSAGPRRR